MERKSGLSLTRRRVLGIASAGDHTADALPKPAMHADVIFMVDTSGSMSDEIEAIKNSCLAFAAKIAEAGSRVRLGLIGFDIGGHHKTACASYRVLDLTHYTIGVWKLCPPQQFTRNIQSLAVGLFGGSGCYLANPDTVDIFPHVIGTFDLSSENPRVLVVISDEMGTTAGLPAIAAQLQRAQITAHVLGVPGRGGAHELLASSTGGQFWDITTCKGAHDFADLLDTVAKTIAEGITELATTA